MGPHGKRALLFTFLLLETVVNIHANIFHKSSVDGVVHGSLESGRRSVTNIAFQPRITISIINDLQPDKSNLTVHCKSGDDDLGTHALVFNQSFEWSFRPNVLGTTLFFCGLGWRDAFGVFDMYRYKRDKKRGCKHYCYWEVAVDEIYGFNDDGINDIIFFWPKSPDRSLKHKPRSDIVSRYIRTK